MKPYIAILVFFVTFTADLAYAEWNGMCSLLSQEVPGSVAALLLLPLALIALVLHHLKVATSTPPPKGLPNYRDWLRHHGRSHTLRLP